MTGLHPHLARDTRAEIVSDPGVFAGMRETWNELLRDSESDGFFLTWEWTWSWWQHLAGQRKLMLIVVRAGERLVGIAPFALRPAAIRSSPPLRCVEMLGSGTAGSDHLDVIARKGWEAECAKGLAGVLAQANEMLALARLRGGNPFAQALITELREKGWHAEARAGAEVCPYVKRPPGGFAEYLAGLGSEHRYAFRRKTQALQKRHQVTFEAAKTEEERRAALEVVIELHKKRWQHRDSLDEAFDSDANIAFHQEISARALASGWLRLFVLRADNQPVAALYGFAYGKVFSFYQSGFDPVWGKQSVGLITMGLAIERAFDEGLDEFDLLHGDEAYKFHWAREVHELLRAELYPPGALGALFRGITELAKGARSAGRKLLRPNNKDGGHRAAAS